MTQPKHSTTYTHVLVYVYMCIYIMYVLLKDRSDDEVTRMERTKCREKSTHSHACAQEEETTLLCVCVRALLTMLFHVITGRGKRSVQCFELHCHWHKHTDIEDITYRQSDRERERAYEPQSRQRRFYIKTMLFD